MQKQIFKCDFCMEDTDDMLILRTTEFQKKDNSDIILCNKCTNLYANHEYDKLEKRMKI